MRLSMGYPGRNEELELLRSGGTEPELEQLKPVLTAEEVRDLQREWSPFTSATPSGSTCSRWSRGRAATRRWRWACQRAAAWRGSAARRRWRW